MRELSPERRREADALLEAALDRPPDARTAFVAGADVSAESRAVVMRLLGLVEQAERFLSRPAAEFAAGLFAADELREPALAPERIGPYRILGEAGRGGMGTVYLAERDDPQLRQRVALKLVRSGPASDALVRRFLEERQILALLDHPGIARLVDGGISEDGLPWFAMEYVEGTPIDRYCDERRLGVEERLGLFLGVCEAVQYAHRNLVVHRDLKPSNILVTGDGHVKLLDFGIAKLLAGAAGTAPAATQAGLRPMTPEYASPEQVRGDPVSTASDVYSLGVLLYELLTGRHPHPASGRPPHEVARAILEEQPSAPSAVVGTAAVRRRLRGDLDIIVLAALRKEPERRYPTPDRLAADVRRHLDGMPVSARPDTWAYRARKFVGRHRAAVAGTIVAAVLLVGYGITVTLQSRRVALEAARTEQVKDFLASLFISANPGVSKGDEPTASELVEQGAARVAVELADQPEIQAEMMTLLGRVYLTMGRYDAAIEQLEGALAAGRRLHGDVHAGGAETARLLAEVLHYQGYYDRAERLLREVVATRRLSGERSREVGTALNDLGDLLHSRGHFAAAEDVLREALAIQIAASGDDGDDAARARRDLANVLRDTGERVEAEALYRRSLRTSRARLGRVDPIVALTQNELARLLAETGGHAEAEAILRENLETYARLYPDGHPMVGTTMRNLGILRLRQGRSAEAVGALREAVAIYRATLSERSGFIPRAQAYLAAALLAAGDAEAAAATAEEALRNLRSTGLDALPATAEAVRVLGATRG